MGQPARLLGNRRHGKVKPGSVENAIFSGLDWLPTLVANARLVVCGGVEVGAAIWPILLKSGVYWVVVLIDRIPKVLAPDVVARRCVPIRQAAGCLPG
jgi:hypothetical protein